MSEQPFKFSAAAVPQAPVAINDKPRAVLTHAERIDAARAVAIQHDRESNADPNFGGQHTPSFFIDYGKGSRWLARHITHLAQMIDTKIAGKSIVLGQTDSFNPATGIFEALDGLSLFDLTVAYKIRVKELGLSEALLEEYAAQIHTRDEDAKFCGLPFAVRMELFRSAN